ncbi:MAG TPA: AMP-binding protein, partial [Paracoccaceae bacterium]|nr:AMP-binding protein [Paracoccaceae bacterium]
MQDRFHWHDAARLIAPDGVFDASLPGAPVIPGRPPGAALARAFGAAAQGLAFRIGAPEAPPPDPGPGMFETLTSGSTGAPRRIRRSQASWISSFHVNALAFGIRPGLRIGVPGDLTASLSLYGAVEGLCMGAEVHLLAGLRPDRQRAALAQARVALVWATPAQLRALADAPGPVLPDLLQVVTGGAALDGATRAALSAMAPGARVTPFYGAAEASFIAWGDGALYPGVHLEVRDDTGSTLPDGQPGTIALRSPYLFEGYAGADPGGAVWRDGWLCLDEYARRDAGRLTLLGRAGRMVTVADRNVWPEPIEAFLAARPGITRAAVLARPDARRGHVLIAVAQGDPAAGDAALRAARRR